MTDESEGKRQVIAGANLLLWSHLVTWDPVEQFKPNTWKKYTCWWKANVQPVNPDHGRVITWTIFSVGAEYFAKGVCLLQDVRSKLINEGLSKKGVFPLPSSNDDINKWIMEVHEKKLKKEPKTIYRTLGDLEPVFKELAKKSHLSCQDQIKLIGGYRLLTDIRNRDAHIYKQGVREGNFYLVERLFAPCLNILVRCIPEGGSRLDKWLKS